MQSVSAQFAQLAQADMRPLKQRVMMSFTKDFDPNVAFFTIEQSAIGGIDIIKGNADVVQEWDKYEYMELSDRVLHVNWQNETEPYLSITMPTADVTFDNSDNFFTVGSGSAVDGYVLPKRPIKIYAGFGNEAIPVFVGLTRGSPIIDNNYKTATFTCIGFLSSLMNKPLGSTVMLTNVRADEALEALFNSVGISSNQLDLGVGLGTIPFLYFEKDTTLGFAIEEIIERENGRLYMTEYGVITFRNRQTYNTDSVYTFNPYTNLNDYVQRDESNVITVVEVRGKVRQVQPLQLVYKREYAAIEIPPSSTLEQWVEFSDPVTTLTTPVIDGVSSRYTVNTSADGSGGSSTDVVVDSIDLFSTTAKITFENLSANTLYVTSLYVYGTPAAVVENIFVRVGDEDAIDKYDEIILRVDNDLLQSSSAARSKAISLLDDYMNFGEALRIEVKGTPALQIDDTITVNYFGYEKDYKITRIQGSISLPGKFTQIIDLRHFERAIYFTIGLSAIGGDHPISP